MKKVHRVIEFNQNARVNLYIDVNTDLRKKAKSDFEKDFFDLMNNAAFGKITKNMRKHRDIKLVTTERGRLASEPNYHTTKIFMENVLAIKMEKTEILMNKLVHLGLSIQELQKILTLKFWYDNVKPRYGEKSKLCYSIWLYR